MQNGGQQEIKKHRCLESYRVRTEEAGHVQTLSAGVKLNYKS